MDFQFKNSSQNNEGITQLCIDLHYFYQLIRDNCSALVGDAVKYNVKAFELLKPTFRFAVDIYDMIHLITNAIVAGLELEVMEECIEFNQECNAVFKNSIDRKASWKKYVQENLQNIDDEGSMNQILDQVLPNEAEEILGQAIRGNYDGDDEKQTDLNVSKALKKKISYNGLPPRYIKSM